MKNKNKIRTLQLHSLLMKKILKDLKEWEKPTLLTEFIFKRWKQR